MPLQRAAARGLTRSGSVRQCTERLTATDSAMSWSSQRRQRASARSQHVVGERADPADLLGQVDEVVRRDRAVARVGPADQRLDRDDVGGLGVDDRLEDDADLPVGHRLLELGAQLQAAQALLVEHRVVAGHAAGVGGGEQGDVGPLHERAGVGAVHRRGGDADGQRDLEVQPGDPGAGGGGLAQPAGGALGGGQRQPRQQDGELLALHAGEQRLRRRVLAQQAGGDQQQLVAGRVPEGVGDLGVVAERGQDQPGPRADRVGRRAAGRSRRPGAGGWAGR